MNAFANVLDAVGLMARTVDTPPDLADRRCLAIAAGRLRVDLEGLEHRLVNNTPVAPPAKPPTVPPPPPPPARPGGS